MDSQGRTEAALAAFNGAEAGPDPADAADPNVVADADGADPNVDPNAEPAAVDPNAAEGQLTDEQRNADPVYQELSTFKDEVSAVFDKHGLSAAAESNGRTPHEEADLQLSDANVLYSIMRGESTPSRLLDTMVKVGNWGKAQKDAVAGDLVTWLTKAGYLKDGQATAQSGQPGKDGQQFKDPLEERISKIETANERNQREQQERTVQVERNRVGQIFTDHVGKLCTDAGIAKEDIPLYATQIGALVNGNKAITDRVAKNNFVDIKKFFDTVHNRELARLKRFNDAELKRQSAKSRNPKSPAGGWPAAPAGQAKRNFANRDDRIATAAEILHG